MKGLAGSLKLELAQFREMENFARLGFVLDDVTTALLDKGGKLMKLLTQPYSKTLFLATQLILLYGGLKGFFKDLGVNKITHFEECFVLFFHKSSFCTPIVSLISSGIDNKLNAVFVNSLLNSFKLFYLKELNELY
jgi:F-type H+-transporting ATPase subunit alpha